MSDEFPDDAAEEAALAEAAKVLSAHVPPSWTDKRYDSWHELYRALEEARKAENA